ncbi:MAG: hypothetical protein SOR93_02870 [Clostridiales Family XIII bacterium]|uniref:Uncharacterized protein n=1 Tax=Hominibacterium faecale TaxID=2839743 RepID=A0A9J6QR59_9FIRM|nr:hypothetical protein [Hominibacterium faecale]MCI7301412.1 hypothetical protein [Clostridia bacterium]MCU7378522.1 hypothetical protein [Hominibacterium faecale]MDY3010189.1 hypothetical protein [Clostridiales Family XIII bacterium]
MKRRYSQSEIRISCAIAVPSCPALLPGEISKQRSMFMDSDTPMAISLGIRTVSMGDCQYPEKIAALPILELAVIKKTIRIE